MPDIVNARSSAPDFTLLSNAPDFALLSPQQLCLALGISRTTLDTMELKGEAPPRVQVTQRRLGYPIGRLREWLAKRSST